LEGNPLLNPAARHRIRRTAGGIQLPRIDGRTVSARRYRDLVIAYEAEVGGVLSESERATIQQAAALTLRAEELQADLVLGKPIDNDLLVRLTNGEHSLELAIQLDFVSSKRLQLVRIERLAERLLADQRTVGQFLLPVRLYVIGGSNECSPCLIDGEVVIIGDDGTHDFRALRGP
jgi:hypothetical protein